ncbi:site-specific integrase [Bacillus pseudomycoides]|uniref:site-specific integrase n=1 Tax=Bacillus pseudomycoides TaxID=64104 RepID=UPI0028D08B6F|nr:site-specific integrase [Bacillus pseudomycoides]
MVNYIHRILTISLNQAVKLKLININPTTLVEIPKKEKTSFQVWDEDEIKHSLDITKKTRYHIAYILAITTGMRLGEILGLRWQDVDLKNKTISINQTLSPDNQLVLDTKTSSSRRLISIDERTIEALQKHKSKINIEKIRLGPSYIDYDLIVCTKIGNRVCHGGFHDTFNTYIKKSGIKDIRLHDLRHTHATLLLTQGVHPKVVSERLGHKDIYYLESLFACFAWYARSSNKNVL